MGEGNRCRWRRFDLVLVKDQAGARLAGQEDTYLNKVYLQRGNLRGGRATLREVILPTRKMEQSECESAWFPWYRRVGAVFQRRVTYLGTV